MFEGCSPKLCLLSLDGEKQSHELVKRVMGNLGWDHLTFLGREQVLPQVTGKRWEEPGLVSLGEGGWGALLATGVSQVAPGKGGRGTPLWDHLRAAGQEGTTGATPIPHHHIIFINAGSGVEEVTNPQGLLSLLMPSSCVSAC